MFTSQRRHAPTIYFSKLLSFDVNSNSRLLGSGPVWSWMFCGKGDLDLGFRGSWGLLIAFLRILDTIHLVPNPLAFQKVVKVSGPSQRCSTRTVECGGGMGKSTGDGLKCIPGKRMHRPGKGDQGKNTSPVLPLNTPLRVPSPTLLPHFRLLSLCVSPSFSELSDPYYLQ